MNINPEFISTLWMVIGVLGCAFFLYAAVRGAPWWHLIQPRDLNVFICAVLGLWFLWSMEAGLTQGLSLHLLGATVLTLMFGWAFAILGITIIMIAVTLVQDSSWLAIPWNILLLGVLPVMLTHRLYRLVDRYLPNNFFIYVFICAFLGAALSMAAVVLATSMVHYWSGAYSFDYIQYNYLRYGLLIMFPEAFLSGAVMSVFVAYRPQWVSTFDDQRYLRH